VVFDFDLHHGIRHCQSLCSIECVRVCVCVCMCFPAHVCCVCVCAAYVAMLCMIISEQFTIYNKNDLYIVFPPTHR